MYTPGKFEWTDDLMGKLAFMQRYNFAIVASASDGRVLATHAPVVVRELGGELRLQFHLARENEQTEILTTGSEARVIFAGPHGYISPRWYANKRTVPTWNYTAIHAHGKPRVMTDDELVRHLCELVSVSEQAVGGEPWLLNSVGGGGGKMVQGMVGLICGFELVATRIQAKRKLNQNRSRDDRLGVIAALRQTGGSDAAALADLMEQVLDQGETELDD